MRSDGARSPRFTTAELQVFRGQEVPDLLPGSGDPPVSLLFAGINPGLWTAATQTHFAHPTNRFYPALLKAGIITRPVDPAAGMAEAERDHLRGRGIGITNLVRRATARADELTTAEVRAGGEALRALVGEIRPRVVAIAGLTDYRTAFRDRAAVAGLQPEQWGSTQVWAVPNPSGLNAHHTVDSLAHAYGAAAWAAGIEVSPEYREA